MAETVATRLKVGLPMVVAFFALIGWDHSSGRGWGLGILAAALTAWGAREIAKLLRHAGAPPRRTLMVVSGGALILVRVAAEELKLPWLLAEGESLGFALFLFAVLFPPLLGTPSREAFLGISGTVFGVVYVWFLGSYVVRLRYLSGIGEAAAAYAIVVSKGSDVFAYFTGKLLGKTKLIPEISPGKTVAGFVGGLLGGVVITAVFAVVTPLASVFPLRFAIPIGIVMGLITIAGDLVESLFKRSAELKDSARLLPSFGGILDVTDSILTAAPATYYLVLLLRPLVAQGIV